MSIVTAVLRFRKERILILQGFPDAKKTILRVDDKYIVCIKNEVLNGNKSAVIWKQKKLRKFITLKCERILQ